MGSATVSIISSMSNLEGKPPISGINVMVSVVISASFRSVWEKSEETRGFKRLGVVVLEDEEERTMLTVAFENSEAVMYMAVAEEMCGYKALGTKCLGRTLESEEHLWKDVQSLAIGPSTGCEVSRIVRQGQYLPN